MKKSYMFKKILLITFSIIFSYICVKSSFGNIFFIKNNSPLYLTMSYLVYKYLKNINIKQVYKNVYMYIFIILVILLELLFVRTFILSLSIIGIILFFLMQILYIITIFSVIKNKKLKVNIKYLCLSILLALIFTYFEHLGYISENSVKLFYGLGDINYKFILFNLFIYFSSAIYMLFNENFTFLDKIKVEKKELLYRWGVTIVCYLPYYFKFYPGILSYDSFKQIKECLGIIQYSNSHSLLYTLMIKLSLIITNNNMNLSIGLFSLFQLLCISFIFAYIGYYLKKQGCPKFLNIIIFMFFALTPYNAMYSITIWKDVPFAVVIALLTIQYINFANDENLFNNKKSMILLSITTLIAMLFRNNALYMLILSLPILFIVLRKYWKKLALIFISPIIIYVLFVKCFSPILNISAALPREALSIPIQQISAVSYYNYDSLSTKQKEKINKFLNLEIIRKKYDMRVSDPTKETFNNEYFLSNKMEFFKLWFSLFNTNRDAYFRAFVYNSYGYYYPEVVRYIVASNNNYNDLNLKSNPIINNSIDEQQLLNDIRQIPIINLTYSIGFMFWINLFAFAYFINKKKYKYIFINFLFFGLWATLLASPVYAEFRYAYSLFITMPLIICLMLKVSNDSNICDNVLSKNRKRVMFISSVGGHLTQLLELKSIYNNYDYLLITEKTDVTRNMNKKYNIKFLPYGSRSQKLAYPFILLWSCIKSIYYFVKYNPNTIISTGANTAAAMCCLGKLFGKKVIYIESFAKRESPSITGKCIYKLHAYTTFVVQWESMLKFYPNAEYWGWIY